MPMHSDSLVTAAHLKRRQTYAEFEHPLEEGDDFEDADEEEYAGEMAYLLAQVCISFLSFVAFLYFFMIWHSATFK